MLNANLVPQVIDGDWQLTTGYKIGKQLDIDSRAVTALFIANDRMSIGFLHAMRERGIDVPNRLSVIGFDDLEETAYTSPPLTTLRQDFRELGNRAMNLLLSEIAGRSTRKLDRLIPELVLRASTTTPPKL
jgi:DNA-binding LacI/PurR family transcriptional regulator